MALRTQQAGVEGDGDSAIVAEINITPLTDIFLVLLIIFMVTSSVLTQSGVEVNLPKASAQVAESQPDGVIVTLLPNNEVAVQGERVATSDWPAFETRLRGLISKAKNKLVILEGDRKSFLGNAIEVMDHARRAGADRFAIATTLDEKK